MHLRAFVAVLALLGTVESFQTKKSHELKSVSYPTRCKEQRRKFLRSRSFTKPMYTSEDNTFLQLSNDSQKTKSNNDYNDDAFGFVFLVGYIATRDIIFTGTFLLLSSLAAIATRIGKLPATKAVPAAVAGFTLIANLLIPKEKIYEILPFIQGTEPALPYASSWLEMGFCAISMLYGFILSSSSDEKTPHDRQ